MATISAVIRWADNTDELKRNLKEGIAQIEQDKKKRPVKRSKKKKRR